MRRVEQGISRVVGGSLVDDSLVLEGARDGKISAAIGDGVLVQQDGGSQGLDRVGDVLVVPLGVGGAPGDLADVDPQLRVLDVSGGLVIARQEAGRGLGVAGLGARVQVRELRLDILGARQLGRVRLRADQQEVVAPGVPGRAFGDVLLDGYLLGRGRVGDAQVDDAVLQVVDRLSGVTLVPGDIEGLGAIVDAGLDEGVGEGWECVSMVERFVGGWYRCPPLIKPL